MKNIAKWSLDFLKHWWKIILLIVIILTIVLVRLNSYLNEPVKIDKDFSKVDLGNANKLMIVAHPDDDILWGGAHLIRDDYLVVCITCGPVKERANEITKVMNETNDKLIMLGYPDKTNGKRDTWDDHRDNIAKDIKAILELRDWETVVTHNPLGEYGHQHHIMTNRIVTDAVEDKSKLYYFGRYYSKKEVGLHYSEMTPISDTFLKEKQRLIGLYKSQSFIQTMFDHMFAYEDWESYDKWGDIDDKEL